MRHRQSLQWRFTMKDGIAIIGYGVVGKSLLDLFSAHGGHKIAIYDPAKGWSIKSHVNDCRIAFVCVPTPTAPDGSCDTAIVEEVIQWCDSDIIVVRSTVAPGTTDRLRRQTDKRIIFQPEYIGETVAHPLVDHQAQSFSILGGPIKDTSPVADLYKGFYHAGHRFHFCSAICAELTKYMENAFYATKVTFCNEWFDIARAFGVDFNELRETWLADPRISRDHTFVYPDNRGFSGKCLPKDTSAIIAASQGRGVMPRLLESVMEVNGNYRLGDPTYARYRRLFGRPVRYVESVASGCVRSQPVASVTGPSQSVAVPDLNGNRTGDNYSFLPANSLGKE